MQHKKTLIVLQLPARNTQRINTYTHANQLTNSAVFAQSGAGNDSAIDLDIGPQIDGSAVDNYRTIKLVLVRMTQLCVRDTGTGRKARKHEQRLLRNMGVHLAVLDLLRIPYDKVVTRAAFVKITYTT